MTYNIWNDRVDAGFPDHKKGKANIYQDTPVHTGDPVLVQIIQTLAIIGMLLSKVLLIIGDRV